MKRIICLTAMLLTLCMLPLALFGCNGGEPAATQKQTEKPTEKTASAEEAITGTRIELADNADKLKMHGRYQVTDSGIACDHTASGIEFNGVMKGKVYVDIRCDKSAYFTVFVDGMRERDRFYVTGGRKAVTIAVAEFDTEGEHNIRILKQTESRYATAEFQALTLDGTLTEPPAQKDTYIEFIGDSLTCGMGNLGTSKNTDAQNAAYEDGTYSYAFLTAQDLDADCSIVAQSGIGIAGSWFDPIGDYYTKLSYNRDTETEYGFERVPDVVVINLGTNDYYLNKNDPTVCTAEQVHQKTKELIALVRSSYGVDMPIVWAYDFGGECMYDTVKAAIDELGDDTAGIYTCKLTGNSRGGEGHPNQSGHIQAAEELTEFIRNILK